MISIIIPTYNRASVLLHTLPSYINQKNVDEIIIVDDGSTDSTDKAIDNFVSENRVCNPVIKYVRHPFKKGAANARLTGINEAKNQYIIFGEDDVIFDENYAEALYTEMEKTDADIIAGRIIYLKENEAYDDAIARYNALNTPLINYNTLEGNFGVNVPNPVNVPFVHACFLAKKEIYSEIRYDTKFYGNGYREETDPQIMALKTGKKIFFTPNAYCYHLHRSLAMMGGQRMNPVKYAYWTIRNNLYFLKKHYDFLEKNYTLDPYHIMVLNNTHATLNRMIPQTLLSIKNKITGVSRDHLK